jgi:hypothetical protein
MDILIMPPFLAVDVKVNIKLQHAQLRLWECAFIVVRSERISVSYVLYANVINTALNVVKLVMRMTIVRFYDYICQS